MGTGRTTAQLAATKAASVPRRGTAQTQPPGRGGVRDGGQGSRPQEWLCVATGPVCAKEGKKLRDLFLLEQDWVFTRIQLGRKKSPS